MKVRLRPATRADYVHIYGEPPKYTFRGIVGELDDGTLAGIGGILYGSTPLAFMDLRVDAREHRKALVKATKMLMEAAREQHLHVFAVPQDEETAPRFLEHFGFKPQHGGWYRWN